MGKEAQIEALQAEHQWNRSMGLEGELFTMNVLSVIHYPGFGGPYNRNIQLYPVLKSWGVQTYVLIPEEKGTGEQRLIEAEVSYIKTDLSRVRATLNPNDHLQLITGFSSQINGIRKIIREKNIDVVAINGSINPHAAVAAHLENCAVVWMLLDSTPPLWARAGIMPLILSLSDIVLCTGFATARDHPGTGLLGDRLMSFIPAVDLDVFRPNDERRKKARAELNIPDDGFCIGTVGSLNTGKLQDYLIRAFQKLHPRHPKTFLRILGEKLPTHQTYFEKLVEESEKNGLSQQGAIEIVHPGKRVPALLPSFDLFVLPSQSEGIPTVVLEAMACGIPVISTDVGSVSEVVVRDETCLLVEPLREDQLEDAIEQLLGSPERLASMGQAGLDHARANFGKENCAQTFKEAYERAIEYRKKRKSPLRFKKPFESLVQTLRK